MATVWDKGGTIQGPSIQGNALEPFFGSGGPMGAPKGPLMAKMINLVLKTGLVSPNWSNSVGQWGKQDRAKPSTKMMQWNHFTGQEWTPGLCRASK